jgi:hypothetical protein
MARCVLLDPRRADILVAARAPVRELVGKHERVELVDQQEFVVRERAVERLRQQQPRIVARRAEVIRVEAERPRVRPPARHRGEVQPVGGDPRERILREMPVEVAQRERFVALQRRAINRHSDAD